jgi:NAD(P)H-flavin reductase
VVSNVREAEGLRLINIKVPESLASGYKTPGQYLKIKTGDGKPGFYAIASPPDNREEMTFLVKETSNNGFMTEAKAGGSLDLSSAQGKGFAIEEYFDTYRNDWSCTNILLLAAGSGIAPIAAAIESDILSLQVTAYQTLFERKATLYVGARDEEHLPFRSKFEEWKKRGVEVVPVYSKPSAGSGWGGKTGYVQDALKTDGIKVPRNTGALLCGQKEMTENCREILLEAGVFEGRVLLNF